eukprot:11225740-Lingulodinium_polyedra.AAC.1
MVFESTNNRTFAQIVERSTQPSNLLLQQTSNAKRWENAGARGCRTGAAAACHCAAAQLQLATAPTPRNTAGN